MKYLEKFKCKNNDQHVVHVYNDGQRVCMVCGNVKKNIKQKVYSWETKEDELYDILTNLLRDDIDKMEAIRQILELYG